MSGATINVGHGQFLGHSQCWAWSKVLVTVSVGHGQKSWSQSVLGMVKSLGHDTVSVGHGQKSWTQSVLGMVKSLGHSQCWPPAMCNSDARDVPFPCAIPMETLATSVSVKSSSKPGWGARDHVRRMVCAPCYGHGVCAMLRVRYGHHIRGVELGNILGASCHIGGIVPYKGHRAI